MFFPGKEVLISREQNGCEAAIAATLRGCLRGDVPPQKLKLFCTCSVMFQAVVSHANFLVPVVIVPNCLTLC